MITLSIAVLAFILGWWVNHRRLFTLTSSKNATKLDEVKAFLTCQLRRFVPAFFSRQRHITAQLSALYASTTHSHSGTFIDHVVLSSQTIETYFNVGELLRKQGDIAQAEKVHQSLLSSPLLSQKQKQRAQFALCDDYMQAGLLDRAEAIYRSIRADNNREDNEHIHALKKLKSLYELMHDWPQAIDITAQLAVLDASEQAKYRSHQAHFCCEQAQFYLEHNQHSQRAVAKGFIKQSIECVPNHSRAHVLTQILAILEKNTQNSEMPWPTSLPHNVVQSDTATDQLIGYFLMLEGKVTSNNKRLAMLRYLQTYYDENASTVILWYRLKVYFDYLSDYKHKAFNDVLADGADSDKTLLIQTIVDDIQAFITKYPAFLGSASLIQFLLEKEGPGNSQLAFYILQSVYTQFEKSLRFECHQCGFSQKESTWRCPSCQSWETMIVSLD